MDEVYEYKSEMIDGKDSTRFVLVVCLLLFLFGAGFSGVQVTAWKESGTTEIKKRNDKYYEHYAYWETFRAKSGDVWKCFLAGTE